MAIVSITAFQFLRLSKFMIFKKIVEICKFKCHKKFTHVAWEYVLQYYLQFLHIEKFLPIFI